MVILSVCVASLNPLKNDEHLNQSLASTENIKNKIVTHTHIYIKSCTISEDFYQLVFWGFLTIQNKNENNADL